MKNTIGLLLPGLIIVFFALSDCQARESFNAPCLCVGGIDTVLNPVAAEDLEVELIKTMYDVSTRNGKFRVCEERNQCRYVLQATIDTLILPPTDSQRLRIARVDTIFEKYRRINEKIAIEAQEDSDVANVVGKVAVNVLINSITMPMGVACFIWGDTDPSYASMTTEERQLVESHCLHSVLIYDLSLTDLSMKKEWKTRRKVDMVLTREMAEGIQLKRLIKGSLSDIERRFRLFR